MHIVADVDHYTAGHTHYIGVGEQRVTGTPSGLTDPFLPTYFTSDTNAHLAALAPGDPTLHTYMVRVRTTHADPPLGPDLAVALAAGLLVTEADYEHARDIWLADRIANVSADLAPAEVQIAAAGATVLEVGTSAPYIVFRADEPAIRNVQVLPIIEELIFAGRFQQNQSLGIHGAELQAELGLDAFHTLGEDVDGDGVVETFQGEGQHLAVYETSHIRHPDHPGLSADPPPFGGGSPFARTPRILSEVSCQVGAWSTTCSDTLPPVTRVQADSVDGVADGRGTHATQVVSALLGDVINNQDFSLWGASAAQHERSFAARHASADMYATGHRNKTAILRTDRKLWDAIEGASPPHHQVNLSWGWTDELKCDGRGRSRRLEDALEAGVLAFVAAGNQDGPGGACTIIKPADSFGALAVAGTHDGSRLSFSGQGEGPGFVIPPLPGRRIVGVSAPGTLDYTYFLDSTRPPTQNGYTDSDVHIGADVEGWVNTIDFEQCNGLDDDGDGDVDEGFLDSDGDGVADCLEPYVATGTSLAAPGVAGAMAVFREYYIEKYSRLIDDPGILMVQTLIHASEGGFAPTPGSGSSASGFNAGLGAGGLRVRVNDSVDLAPPWAWGTGHMCVREKLERDFPITTSMPAGVKELRVVAWWFDKPGARDEFRLDLVENGVVVASDQDPGNNRNRIVLDSPNAGSSYLLRLEGTDVRGSESRCNAQSDRVYFAFMFANEVGF